MSKPKSANTAGLLGVFAGFVGAHEWYLGRAVRALMHIGVLILSAICFIVAATILHNNRLASAYGIIPTAFHIWSTIGIIIFIGNALWGAIEGFILLIQGEPGLARRGLDVIDPAARKTLSPKAKKNLIRYSIIGVAALALIGIICLVISLVTRVDYGEAYRVAKELHPHVRALYEEDDCHDVISYVDSASTSAKTYEGYIDECRTAVAGKMELVDKLGQTAGIRRNSELSAKYDDFREAYRAVIPDMNEFDQSLKIYQTIHNFYVSLSGIKTDSSTKQISATADILKDSGSSELKEFGEGWEENFLDYVSAYKAYQADDSADRTSDLYKDMVKARNNYQNWVKTEAPDLDDIADLSLSGVSTMYRAFRSLNDLIRNTYEENYNKNSGDCTESRTGEVYCP